MKTSTKNTIISGAFSIFVAIIGAISFLMGKEKQDNKIEATIDQSGAITIIQNENSLQTVERLLDEYVKIQNNYNIISNKYTDLENAYNIMKEDNDSLSNQLKTLKDENESLNNTLKFQKGLEEDVTPEVISDKYLFDEDPYMVEYVKLYMRNNDRNTIYSQDDFRYDIGYIMSSNSVEYQKGMAITPNSSEQASLYYNLENKYSLLSGAVAFEDRYSDRTDKNYKIYFFGDNNLIESITITKGELPTDFRIDVSNCSILRIVLERPEGDKSNNPNINLIEWKLYS